MGAVIAATHFPASFITIQLHTAQIFYPLRPGYRRQIQQPACCKRIIRRCSKINGHQGTVGDRLALLVGVDDLIVESVAGGACGWIAGLVNAFPVESVRLFDLAVAGRFEEARTLYEWFLPLLRMDTVSKLFSSSSLFKLKWEREAPGSDLRDLNWKARNAKRL